MEAKLTMIVVWCLMVAGGVLADEENRLAGDAGGQENKNNDAQYPLGKWKGWSRGAIGGSIWFWLLFRMQR